MNSRLLVLLILAVAVGGCASWRSKPQQPAANTAAIPAQAAPPASTQSSSYMQVPGAYDIGAVPPMEANRPINEQDCTKEVNLQAGNLKCR